MKRFRRRIISFITLIAFHVAIATPGDAGLFDASTGTLTVSPSFTSKYLYRGVELAGACFQPWIDYTVGNLSVGVWSSFALENRTAGDSDPEIDLYGSYIFSNAAGSFSIVPGVYLYTYPDSEPDDGVHRATVEPSLGAIFRLAGIQFTPKIYYDVTLKGATYEVTAAVALPLTTLGTELDFSATAGTFKVSDATDRTIPAVKNWGDYWMLGLAVPVQVSMHSKVTAAVTYSKGRNNFFKQGTLPRERNENAHGKTAVTLTYSITL